MGRISLHLLLLCALALLMVVTSPGKSISAKLPQVAAQSDQTKPMARDEAPPLGWVLLAVQPGAEGHPGTVVLQASSGAAWLDAAAREAVQRMLPPNGQAGSGAGRGTFAPR